MSKDVKEEVKVVRLITGAGDLDVVAKVVVMPKGILRLNRPLVIRYRVEDNQQHVSFGTYLLPYMESDTVELTVSRDVRFVTDPSEQLVSHYNELFSPIVRPESGIVLP